MISIYNSVCNEFGLNHVIYEHYIPFWVPSEILAGVLLRSLRFNLIFIRVYSDWNFVQFILRYWDGELNISRSMLIFKSMSL